MQNLKSLRKEHNLSQQNLADILHISQQSVYKYENGMVKLNKVNFNIDELIQTCIEEAQFLAQEKNIVIE